MPGGNVTSIDVIVASTMKTLIVTVNETLTLSPGSASIVGPVKIAKLTSHTGVGEPAWAACGAPGSPAANTAPANAAVAIRHMSRCTSIRETITSFPRSESGGGSGASDPSTWYDRQRATILRSF
jgi:hypothetical protein